MGLIISYVGYENVVNLVTNYDSQLLFVFVNETYKSSMPNIIDEPQM